MQKRRCENCKKFNKFNLWKKEKHNRICDIEKKTIKRNCGEKRETQWKMRYGERKLINWNYGKKREKHNGFIRSLFSSLEVLTC